MKNKKRNQLGGSTMSPEHYQELRSFERKRVIHISKVVKELLSQEDNNEETRKRSQPR